MFLFVKDESFTAVVPILTCVEPYTTDVFAAPYTSPLIVPPVIKVCTTALLFEVEPLAAAFPPPYKSPEIDVVPSTIVVLFPLTTAADPLPPP